MTAIEAAKMEAAGRGAFVISGRKITFKDEGGLTYDWSANTEKEARDQLRLFRASPRYC